MTNEADLLSKIRDTLGRAVRPSLTKHSNVSDLFEAYVFSLVVEAAKAEGASVGYLDVAGNPVSLFVFRTSPGHIFSTVHPYTYAVIEFSGKPLLEAHLGVRVSGRSKVLHEADVAVIRHDEAETCRRNMVPPRSSRTILVVECKFYSTSIPLYLARSFMGLDGDLSTQDCYFVVNTASDSAEKLLAHHRKRWEHYITPGSSVEVDRLRNLFQDTFKNFKAKSSVSY